MQQWTLKSALKECTLECVYTSKRTYAFTLDIDSIYIYKVHTGIKSNAKESLISTLGLSTSLLCKWSSGNFGLDSSILGSVNTHYILKSSPAQPSPAQFSPAKPTESMPNNICRTLPFLQEVTFRTVCLALRMGETNIQGNLKVHSYTRWK